MKKLLLASAALAALSSPLHAQAVPPAADIADGAELESPRANSEIIVTARRRQETAQEVPLAISVVGANQIESTGNFNILKLQQLAPTLQVYSSNPRNTSVNIRGLGVPFGLTSDGFEQGVGIYVDDVYNSRVAAAVFDFLDVGQVEVLRGPQGTLYGKNTTAGAINITTNQPTFDFEGRAEVTAGNLKFKQAKAAVSGPLSDKVAVRVAGGVTSRRGTLYNPRTNQYINEQDNLGVRGTLLFKPTDDLKITLSGDYSKQDPLGFGTTFVRVGRTQRAIGRQYDALVAAANAAGRNYQVPSRNPYDRLTDLDSSLNAGNKIGGASLKAVWDTDAGTFTSITAWRFWDWKPENDRDFTGLSIVSKSQNPSQQDQYSQEFRYNYDGEKVDFVAGLFGFKQRIDTQGTESQGIDASRWSLTGAQANDPSILNGLTATNTQYLKSTSAAAFAQAAWKVTDQLTIQPGIRLNYDKKSGFYERVVTNGAGAVINCTVPPGGPALSGNLAAQCGVYQPQSTSPSVSKWNFSYDLNVNYKFAPGILGYATYAKTFKTVGINQNGLPLTSANVPDLTASTVKPESLHHFEVGMKTQFWDRKATFNVSAFRTNIRNFQATVNGGQFGTVRGYLANADKVRSQGIETDFRINPSERFLAYVSGAYTDAKYKKFTNAPCPPELSGGTLQPANAAPDYSQPGVPGALSPRQCDISGQRLPGVSRWSASFGAEANVPVELLANEGQAYLGVDGNYRSHWNSNASPSIYTEVKGYVVTNVRAGFRTDRFDIFGWVRNAFDKKYIDLLQVAPGNVGLIAGTLGDQRTWGATVKAKF
ncbi:MULTISPECIES: TonB-dependent receptor [unclassified Sphingomonas]|uniref:TonB-dependent receptor n=1 Tax=unclassified Sphingomonas TaxID=196159 RepID=UPI0006F85FE2|nr:MULTISPECIES: TonB-dependent receptor [unclassified Sphingomonas]KQX22686.1 TonB-dependent receptor [Sphingomonas sp. Root1294]KQY67834.1 TonB-dependent receptor [Sphingomonas sp. Root50]KRB88758.1 TonB-dependent receptor [Sphingomonas sp. Root720]